MKRNWIALVLVGMLLILSALPVYAISNPTSISIDGVAVFSDVATAGDQLWVCRYSVNYTVTPTESASTAFSMGIYNSDGTATGYGRPLNYYNSNMISVYLLPVHALTWGSNYSIRIFGNPALFSPLVEGVNMVNKPLSASDYYAGTQLQTWLTGQVQSLEILMGQDLITSSSKLTDTGAVYMLKAIPSLNNMIPNFFSSTAYFPAAGNVTVPTSLAGVEEFESHMGSQLQSTLDGMADMLGIVQGHSLYESYTSGADSVATINSTVSACQTFMPTESHRLDWVKMQVYRVGSPTTITVGIYATAAGSPTGAVLASGTLSVSSLTTSTSGEWKQVDMTTGYQLTRYTTYAIVATGAVDAGNNVNWKYDSGGGYSGGQMGTDVPPAAWVMGAGDFMFEEGTNSGGTWIGMIITVMSAMTLGGIAFSVGGNPQWSLGFAAISLPLFYWIAVTSVQVAVLFGLILGVIFGVIFILGRF